MQFKREGHNKNKYDRADFYHNVANHFLFLFILHGIEQFTIINA